MNKQVSGIAGIIDDKTIDRVLEIILSEKPEDLVLGVMAPTGSGKSTTLIEGIQRKASEKLKASVKIFVVQPTIPATMGLFNRMTNLYGDEINIGYAAESNVVYTDDTQIVYCTDGHMENKMLSNFKDGAPIGPIDFCHILVLDEAHRGALAQDTVVALWRTALLADVIVPKLVFVSATLSMQDIGFEKAKVVKVEPKPFDVEIMYNNKDYEIDSKQLYKDTANAIYEKHKETPINPVSKKPDKQGVIWPGWDVWLCFCPGQKEVLNVTDTLESMIKDEESSSDEEDKKKKKKTSSELNTSNLEVIPIFGSMGSEHYMKIFSPPEFGVRRIIVSTNLAESSVTINFVTWVFDTMTEKYTETTSSGGERLTLGNISRSSAKQRTGRTGRVCPGKVTRMCSQIYFNTRLEDQRQPEIKRVPLHNMIIKILSVGLDPAEVFSGRIEKESLQISIKTLTFLGMIDKGSVTNMGHFATHFPLSVRGSAILWRWIESNHPIFPGIVMTCLIDCYDNQSYFYYPYSKGVSIAEQTLNNNDYYEDHFRVYAGEPSKQGENTKSGLSDLEVLIVMWHHLMYGIESLRPKKSALKKWCTNNSMNHKKIAECLNAMSKVYGTLSRSISTEIKLTGFSPRTAMENITPILQLVYGDNTCKIITTKKKIYQNIKTSKTFTLDSRCPLTLNAPLYADIVALRIRESTVAGGGKRQNFITLYAPIMTTEHIPQDYEIDYSKTNKVSADEDDKYSEGDDIEDLPEDELKPALLPFSISKGKLISSGAISNINDETFFSHSIVDVGGETSTEQKPKKIIILKKTPKQLEENKVLLIKPISSLKEPTSEINPESVFKIAPPKAISPSSATIAQSSDPIRKIAISSKSTTLPQKGGLKSKVSIVSSLKESSSSKISASSSKESSSPKIISTSKRPSKFLDERTLKEFTKLSESDDEEDE